jgi:hypothetical protein
MGVIITFITKVIRSYHLGEKYNKYQYVTY